MVENKVYAADIGGLLGSGAYSSLREALTESRRKKAERFIFEKDRLLCAAAGLLLDKALSGSGVKGGRIEYGEFGKPYLAGEGVFFNISHSEHLAVCAVSDRCVGIDTELIRSFDDDLAKSVFHECEIAQAQSLPGGRDKLLTTLWTVKESVMKYFGTGLSLEPKEITVCLSGSITARCRSLDASALRFTVIEHGSYIVTVCSEYGRFCERLSLTEFSQAR